MGLHKEVNFPLAKLLREKGFEIIERPLFYEKKTINTGSYMYNTEGLLVLVYMPEVASTRGYVDTPTIGQIVDWLYEKHGIWIGVELTDNTLSFYFQPTIWTTKDRDYQDEDMIDQAKRICKWKEWQFNSRTEAYEFAINYCLTKLI